MWSDDAGIPQEGQVMSESGRFYLTTAIDYPNSRPHIGTAFEKLGADVQARYRRMEGYHVHFLMGNDENTVKVSKKAAELGLDPQAYCNDMARQFKEVWRSLDISFDDFIQTSEPRHHEGCRKFIQKVYDNGYIYQGTYEGWYCEGCESFKTEKELEGGKCPIHKTPAVRRSEPCHYFAWSRFQDRLLALYDEHPEFIEPESRRNEVIAFVGGGLQDVNVTRFGETWGIRVPFDERFTIYVWFDALLNYITAIGYGTDQATFEKWWPANMHFVGKDITRFHCALWPAMLMAADVPVPKQVFAHGFVHRKNETTGEIEKQSKALGNVIDPMEIITRFNSEAFRYYFLRECPYPGDGEFSWQRFSEVYNADLANNLGNMYSRVVRLMTQGFEGHLAVSKRAESGEIYKDVGLQETVEQIENHIEACQYHQALQKIWLQVLDPVNQYTDRKEPWKVVKTDKVAAQNTLYDLVEQLRCVAILIKPFLPRTAETVYCSFNFHEPWEKVRYEDVWNKARHDHDIRVVATLQDGKPKPLFPRIA
jgi:methionyl-tRNA synthetase